MRSSRRRGILQSLLRNCDDVAHISDPNDRRVSAAALAFVVAHSRNPDHDAAGCEDGATGAAGRKREVGHECTPPLAAHRSGCDALLLTERRADREALLTVRDRPPA